MFLLLASVIVALVLLGGTIYVLGSFARWWRRSWFRVAAVRVLTGGTLDGAARTDAGVFRPGLRPLTTSGHALRFWHKPRAHRAVIIWAALAVVISLTAAAVRWPAATASGLAAGLAAAAAGGAFSLFRRRATRTWHLPAHLAAHDIVGRPRAVRASSWIKIRAVRHSSLHEVIATSGGRPWSLETMRKAIETARQGELTYSTVNQATFKLPKRWPADPQDKQRLVTVVSQKLAMESPDATWRLAGPLPQLTLKRSQPPPSFVPMADLLGELDSLPASKLLIGIGKNGQPVTASLSTDSPHIAISMGSGAGKSNLASWLLFQMLLRGGIGLILDAKKGLSYPWLLKDENADWAQIPSVGYARSISQLHACMVWMTKELDRRNSVAMAGTNAAGRMIRGTVGPPLLALAEELNMAVPRLRQHWTEEGGRGKSPAFLGLADGAFAGRAVAMHEALIGQMLTAEVTGSKDSSVKENCGIKGLARYGKPGWRTMVGDLPMPPSPEQPGRIQLVTGMTVREVQTPLFDPLTARRLILAGDMASPPHDMPCVPRPKTDADGVEPGPGQPVVPETRPAVLPAAGLVSLREAVGDEHVRCGLDALRRASTRPGFPPHRDLRGTTKLYDSRDLADYDGGRRWPVAAAAG